MSYSTPAPGICDNTGAPVGAVRCGRKTRHINVKRQIVSAFWPLSAFRLVLYRAETSDSSVPLRRYYLLPGGFSLSKLLRTMTCALFSLFVAILAFNVGANVIQGTIDVEKLKKIFEENIKSKDVSTVYWAARGLHQLNIKIGSRSFCEEFKKIKIDESNIEEAFYLSNAASHTGCVNTLHPSLLRTAALTLDKKDATIPEIYYAAFTMKALGRDTIYDKEEGFKNLIQLLKKDDSAANYGYMFELCQQLDCGPWVAQHGDSVLAQADELDGRMLQWEGGLPVTASLLRSILGSYKAQGKPSPLSPTQGYKFAEYLLSRRSVTSARGACLLLEAATALANDAKASPISIAIKGKKFITSEEDSVQVSVTDLLGRAVRGLATDDVLAQSGTRLADDVVVLSKQPLASSPADPTLHTLNLGKIKSQYGLYKIALSAASKTTSVTIGVLGEIQVATADIGVGDIDGTTTPKTTTVAFPKTLADKIEADHLQKVFLKFSVRDKAGKPVLVQQAFVRIGSRSTGDEVIFVAEPDNSKSYKVDLNVGVIAKHFGQQSGSYSVDLYLGDSAIAEPINWRLANVNFKFAGEPTKPGVRALRAARPEIAHEFRVAEARPPRVVSDVFAAACAAPLLLLLIMWARLGVNFNNFPFTISALLFHTGLGSILGLFVVFWLRLSMFETVRYLLALGLLTFLSGHRLLRHLVHSNKSTH